MLFDYSTIIKDTPLENSLHIPYDDLLFTNQINALKRQFEKAKNTDQLVVVDKTREAIHEPEQLEEVGKWLDIYNIKDRTIVLDTTQDETLYEKNNIRHVGAMFHVWNYIINSDTIKKPPQWYDKPCQKFICLNNWSKPHRFETIKRLHQENLISYVDWSYRQSWDNPFFATPKYIDQPDVNIKDFDQNQNLAKLYGNCVVSIVNETDYYNKGITHITEKSLMAIYHATLPIIVSVPGSVELLRLHGFDMFDDIINHDYDKEQDNSIRFDKIFKEIHRVNTLPNLLIIKQNLRERFAKNQSLMLNKSHWLNYYKQKLLTID